MHKTAPKTALITGASRGIGREIALQLAAQNFHIIALARTVGALEALDDAIRSQGGTATIVTMDLARLDKIDALGPSLAERFTHLDVFVANAAILGTLTPIAHHDPKDYARVMDVNFTANARLIRTLDPLLRASKAACAMFNTCTHVARHDAYWAAYSTSKAALACLAEIYAQESQHTTVTVLSHDPGPTASGILNTAYPGGYSGTEKVSSSFEAAQQIIQLMMPALTQEKIAI